MIPPSVKGAYERMTDPGTVTILTECTNAQTGAPLYVVCNVVRNEDGSVEAVPAAVMLTYDIRKHTIPPTIVTTQQQEQTP